MLDVDRDHNVAVPDLLMLLAAWEPCQQAGQCGRHRNAQIARSRMTWERGSRLIADISRFGLTAPANWG